MKTWPTKQLGELTATITKGTTPHTLGGHYTKEGIPFLRAENLQGGKVVVDSDTLRIDAKTHSLLARSVIHPNDVLLSIAGTIGRAAVVSDDAPEMNCNQAVGIIRLNSGEILPAYLLLWLKTANAQSQITGAQVTQTISNISLTQIKKFKLSIPPLAKQAQIVQMLDEVDQLRKLRAQADRRTAALIPALFQGVIGGDGRKTLHRVRLEHIAAVVSGVAKGRKFNGRQPVEVPYLRVANVQAGHLNLSEIKTIQALPEEVEELALQKGDVLLTEGGDFDKLGRGAMLERDLPNCIHQNHVFRVRVNPSQVDPVYFANFLQTPEAKRYFLTCAKRTTNLASINMRQLRALPVPVPPLLLQAEFAERVSEIRELGAKQAASRQRLDDLFQSMLHRAFNGEL
jgi:type I restriction enzyme S subunit